MIVKLYTKAMESLLLTCSYVSLGLCPLYLPCRILANITIFNSTGDISTPACTTQRRHLTLPHAISDNAMLTMFTKDRYTI